MARSLHTSYSCKIIYTRSHNLERLPMWKQIIYTQVKNTACKCMRVLKKLLLLEQPEKDFCHSFSRLRFEGFESLAYSIHTLFLVKLW